MRNAHKQREKKREYARELVHLSRPFFTCPNCKGRIRDGHYVPPSLGEDGFWVCDKLFSNIPYDAGAHENTSEVIK